MKIHIIVAMQSEAEHLIQTLNLKQLPNYQNSLVFHGLVGNHNVHLFVNPQKEIQTESGTVHINKVGTVQAALLTYKAIHFQKPDLILNIGTCGGIQKHGVEVFDIVCGKDFVIYHDRYTGDDPASKNQGLGLLKCANKSEHFPNLKHGTIATSNSIVVNQRNWSIITEFQVMVVDMEAAAVAEVAEEFSIPFIALKAVTDLVYEVQPVDMLPQFYANFHKAMNLVSVKTLHILHHQL